LTIVVVVIAQADKDAITLAVVFCSGVVKLASELGLTLGPAHMPRVQPSTAAQLWGPSAAAASGDETIP